MGIVPAHLNHWPGEVGMVTWEYHLRTRFKRDRLAFPSEHAGIEMLLRHPRVKKFIVYLDLEL